MEGWMEDWKPKLESLCYEYVEGWMEGWKEDPFQSSNLPILQAKEGVLRLSCLNSIHDTRLYQISERKNFRNATVVNATAKKQSNRMSTMD